MPDILFNLTTYAKTQKKAIDFVHGSTYDLIKEKREKLKKSKNDEVHTEDDDGLSK